MSDWPQSEKFHKPVLSTVSAEAVGSAAATANIALGAVSAYTSSQAIYVPFVLGANYLVKKVWWHNGSSVSGPIDVGVYTNDGTRLFSSGGTTAAGTNATQSVSVTAYLLTPGSYYFGLCLGVNVGTALISAPLPIMRCQAAGVARQGSVSLLPATATFATATIAAIPLFGITSGTVL